MIRERSAWKWWICGLLLLASAVNYMDRQTLANASHRITTEFNLTQEQYGNLELAFGWAFAAGSLVFGVLADRFPLRWLYPVVLLLWSGAGFATGVIQSYPALLGCRTALGLFEAGHWPCAVKATQRLLEPKDRSLGNSVLQSGTSIGAIVTPLIMRLLLTPELNSWRFAFQAVGVAGLLWIALWFALVRKDDFAGTIIPADEKPQASFWEAIFTRRMLIIIFVVALINTAWQLIRAWLPKFLIEGRGYAETEMLYFNSLFYVATDVGCIGAGFLTLWFHRRGASVIRSRKLAFFICALFSALTLCVIWLPKSPLLLVALLLIGAGALGVFPIYHAFTQDISRHHQGKITGIGGVAAWALSPAQKYYGRLIDQTGSFDLGFAIAGCMPLLAFVALALFWPRDETQTIQNAPLPLAAKAKQDE
jgi:ACS family hexuronate transporter-like MFS transporter